jgi:hypothetical protein
MALKPRGNKGKGWLLALLWLFLFWVAEHHAVATPLPHNKPYPLAHHDEAAENHSTIPPLPPKRKGLADKSASSSLRPSVSPSQQKEQKKGLADKTLSPSLRPSPSAAPSFLLPSSPRPSSSFSKSPPNTRPSSRPASRRVVKKRDYYGRSGWGGAIYAGSMGGISFLGFQFLMPLGTPLLGARITGMTLFNLAPEKRYGAFLISLELAILSWITRNLIRFYGGPRLDFYPLGIRSAAKISDLPAFGFGLFLGSEFFLLPWLSFFVEGGFSSGIWFGFGKINYPGEAFGFLMKTGMYFYF